MKRRWGTVALGLALLLAVPVAAQVAFEGNLFLIVTGKDDQPLEGAQVTLTGPGFKRTATTGADGRLNLIKIPPGTYELEIGAQGYNTNIYPDVKIDTLANVGLQVKMQESTTVEKVVVTAETPLLDKRDTGTSTVLTQEELTQIPQARDPWAVLQTIPGVVTDRTNVGGNEAGQQSVFVGKGSDGTNATWVMDGVDFTDNAASGATASYLDFNAFEQISFVTGGADIEQMSSGLRLNFVQKQGSNDVTGTARLLYTADGLQGDLATGLDNPVTGGTDDTTQPAITEIFEKNFDIGGPIVADWAWFWFGFTQNDINLLAFNAANPDGFPDRTELENTTIKVHGMITGDTTYRAFYTIGDKIKDGRTAVPNRSLPTTWNQTGPSPILSASLSHFFTPNFEADIQYAEVEGGFALTPKAGSAPGTQIIVDAAGTWQGTFIDFSTERPTQMYSARASYFMGTGGWDHELKFGFRYREAERTSVSLYGGDGILAFVGAPGTAGVYREANFGDKTEHTNLWVSDTLLKGPWALNVGLHYSQQQGEQLASSVAANALFPTQVPGLTYGGHDPGIEYQNILPRVGVTYTFPWENRLLLRANFAQYADGLGNAQVGFNNPVAVSSALYPWTDDGDELVEVGELDLLNPISFNNFDPLNPSSAVFTDRIDPDLDAPLTNEFLVGGEYEIMRNFTVGADVTWRRTEDLLWAPLLDLTTTQFDSEGRPTSFGIVPPSGYDCSDVSGVMAGTSLGFSEPVCTLNATGVAMTSASRPTILTNRPGYEQEYTGLELTATKRLSNKWMLRGYISLSDWSQSFDGTPTSSDFQQAPISSAFAVADGDPTNFVGGMADDGEVAIQSGGSGPKGDVWLGTQTWAFNANGLYQLPKNFTISGNLSGREGYAVPLFFVNDVPDADGLTTSKLVQVRDLTEFRYDDLYVMDIKVAKLFNMTGNTRVELAAELFNALDADTTLSICRDVTETTCQFGTVNEALSPQIVRFSATVNF